MQAVKGQGGLAVAEEVAESKAQWNHWAARAIRAKLSRLQGYTGRTQRGSAAAALRYSVQVYANTAARSPKLANRGGLPQPMVLIRAVRRDGVIDLPLLEPLN